MSVSGNGLVCLGVWKGSPCPCVWLGVGVLQKSKDDWLWTLQPDDGPTSFSPTKQWKTLKYDNFYNNLILSSSNENRPFCQAETLTSVWSARRLSFHIYTAGSAGLGRLQLSGWLEFELGGRRVKLRWWWLQLGKRLWDWGLKLRRRGLELSWGLGDWRLELGASSRGWWILATLPGPSRASQAWQQLGERIHVNRATRYLRQKPKKHKWGSGGRAHGEKHSKAQKYEWSGGRRNGENQETWKQKKGQRPVSFKERSW